MPERTVAPEVSGSMPYIVVMKSGYWSGAG